MRHLVQPALLDPRPLLRVLESCARHALGLAPALRTEDRRILEEVILPAYGRRMRARRVLWVGCAPYTKDYGVFFRDAEYWTLDRRPAARRCGASRHIVAALEDLARRAPPESFDLILCNGVLGWGLDRAEQIERAFDSCWSTLRPKGELLLGWNDVPPRNRVPPDAVAALARFRRVVFAPLGASRCRTDTDNRHTYDFFAK